MLNKTMLDRLSEMMVSVCTRAQSFLCAYTQYHYCTHHISHTHTLHTHTPYTHTPHITHTSHATHTSQTRTHHMSHTHHMSAMSHTYISHATHTGNQFRGQVHIPGAREIASHNFGFDISRQKYILVTFSVLSNVHTFILLVYNYMYRCTYMYARHFTQILDHYVKFSFCSSTIIIA